MTAGFSLFKSALALSALLMPFRRTASANEASVLTVVPNKKFNVIYQERGSIMPDTNFSVAADVPVTIMRFDNRWIPKGEAPIETGQVFIFVKTERKNHRCKGFDGSRMVNVTYATPDELGRWGGVTIQTNPPKRFKKKKFLETSSFEARWSYASAVNCLFFRRGRGQDSNGGERKMTQQLDPSRKFPSDSKTPNRQKRRLQTTEKTKKCKATVEVIVDACSRDVQVFAPTVRVMDKASMSSTSGTLIEEEECRADVGATISFVSSRRKKAPIARDQLFSPKLSKKSCDRNFVVVIGRPFIDSGKKSLLATAHASDTPVASASSSWRREGPGFGPIEQRSQTCVEGSNDDRTYHASPPIVPTARNMTIASRWTRQGLGEHASVASFAAFTIHLMTNSAPPNLVRDALHAALDEVNHATTSFEIASLFAGTNIEPGALPPSSHKFEKDLVALALGAAREGCIDETLSALEAAVESDYHDKVERTELREETSLSLRDTLSGIAADEARHSALAWRTVRWICSIHEEACQLVKTDVFSLTTLSSAVKKRRFLLDELEGASMEEEWTLLHETLVPFVTGSSVATSWHCGKKPELAGRSVSIAEKISKDIMEAVLCDGDG